MNRRSFLRLAALSSIAPTILRAPRSFAAKAEVPKRALGSTGERVSAIGIGGFHLGKAPSDDEATRIVRSAVDHGVNFLDNCWDYN